MKTIKVHYQAAEGRYTNQSVDYMMATVEDVELYAEMPVDGEDECGTYDDLKEAILVQADEYNINRNSLQF